MTIVVLAVYFIYTNEKQRDGIKERFEDGTAYVTSINQVFNTLLGRDAKSDEIPKYQAMMKSPADTKDVVSALAETTEYKAVLGKGENKNVTLVLSDDKKIQVDFAKRMELYKTIMQVYEDTLHRLPNKDELDYYTYSMVKDSSFTTSRMKTLLESSKEYEILIKNQTNLVNATLPGQVSEAQLTFMVREEYQEVFGGMPSEEVEEFLKTKYVEYKLNKTKFHNLLLLLKTIDEDNMIITENKTESAITIKSPAGSSTTDKVKSAIQEMAKSMGSSSQQITVDDAKKSNQVVDSEDQQGGTTNGSGTTVQNIFNIINPSPEELKAIVQNASVSKSGSGYFSGGTCLDNYRNKSYLDEFYQGIKETKAPSTCGSKGLAIDRERNLLAEYTNQRNMDELRTSCARNSYALATESAIEDKKKGKDTKAIKATNYFVDTKPSFGTFLEEADNTKVGSIMPKFIFKEYQ